MSAMSSGGGLAFRPPSAPLLGLEELSATPPLPQSLGPSLPWHLTRGGRSLHGSRTEELKRRLGAAAAEQYRSFRNQMK